jgi:phage shock protein A
MAILSRLTRLCRADLHGLMDQIEDRELLLKQHLREMETALQQKELHFKRMKEERTRLQREGERGEGYITGIDGDVAVAVAKGRDDIARALIRKLKTRERQQEEIARRLAILEQRCAQCAGELDEQWSQYRTLQLKAAAYREEIANRSGSELPFAYPLRDLMEPSAEEVELELLKRKQEQEGEPALAMT